ncbi:hypothetical protein [Nonomuraea bangladeshensis]|uniref:hypothetical protein n=1 Tax=Nonomuraea bangladeshensis TaxID=404385 RepID=UPI003C2C1E88
MVQQTAAHAVPDLAPPPKLTITPVRPADPAAAPTERAGAVAAPPAPPVEQPAAPGPETSAGAEPPAEQPVKAAEPGQETPAGERSTAEVAVPETVPVPVVPEENEPAPQPEPALQKRPRQRARVRGVRPTSNADCKGDARAKHTINITVEAAQRLAQLQFDETMRAGREQPLWPHVDAALAVLRPEQCTDRDLVEWAGRAEALDGLTSDDYQQLGTLMRRSVLTTVRTLRVRLRAAGVKDVDVQAVLTVAILAYLDAWEAQGRKPLDE